FIEGDISDCFGSLDHEIVVAILSEKIHDNRFLRLIKQMLKAGYLEDWRWHATLSGAPQGGVLSPLLSNIYMDRLDTFVETVLIPEYTRGKTRRRNPAYQRLENAIWNERAKLARRKEPTESPQVRAWRKQLRRFPVGDPHDPGYRRLRYIRYADDHLLGFTGSKAEAETIKQRLAEFLRDDLKLELNQDKTLITHGRTQAARFLGYDITVQHADMKVSRGGRINRGLRSINGKISLRVPKDVIKAKCTPFLKRGKPTHLDPLTGCTPFDIISLYGAQYRGIVQYYLLAGDIWKLDRLKGVMLTSMLKTLAAKHRSRVTTMAKRYKTTVRTPQGPRRCFEARAERASRKPLIARFGGIPLTRKRAAVLDDLPTTMFTPRSRPRGSQLIDRLRKGWCELCDRRTDVQVHQIRHLADLRGRGEQPAWAQLMLKKRRRTLVVCPPCHGSIHA
ncbi:reverse transcriptase domain-containing protein, partial [Streptomyces sp. NPDC055036]